MRLTLPTLLGHLARELKGLFFNMNPSTCCSGSLSAVAFLSLAKTGSFFFFSVPRFAGLSSPVTPGKWRKPCKPHWSLSL